MKKWMIMMVITALAVIAAACGAEKAEPETNAAGAPEPIEVALHVPEQTDIKKTVALEATVTQSGEAVSDADEVKFEIWKEGEKENSIMIDSTNAGEGVYTAETAFDEEAAYYVQVHVTARQMHRMPKTVVLVGNAVMPAEEESDGSSMEHMNH